MTRVRCTILRDWTGGQLINAIGMKLDLPEAEARRKAEDGFVTIDDPAPPRNPVNHAVANPTVERAVAIDRGKKR